MCSFKRRGLAATACLAAVAALLAASLSPAAGILDSIVADPHGDRADVVAAQRTLAIINRLSAESLEESFDNADYVDDYYYPGFDSQNFGLAPFDSVRVVLSNRRTAKLYEHLRQMPSDAQYALLSRYFDKFVRQYWEIMDKFRADASPSCQDFDILSRISQQRAPTYTAHGTRRALHTMALLSGMLGNARMWPAVRPVFQQPIYGKEVIQAEYNQDALRLLGACPMFPDAIRSEVLFTMAKNITDEDAVAVGLDRRAVLNAAPPDQVRELTIQSYRAEVTYYDMLYRASEASLDMDKGSFKVGFLIARDRGVAAAVVKAAGLQPL